MSDFDDGMIIGLAIGKKKFKGGGKERLVHWIYPDEWLPLPDAGEGECIMLIRPSESRKTFTPCFTTYYSSDLTDFPDYKLVIDWGDGNVETFNNERLAQQSSYTDMYYPHEYADEFVGKYLLVKIQTMYAYIGNGDGTTNRIATSFRGIRTNSNDVYSVLAVSVGKSFEIPESGTKISAMYVRFCMDDFNELSVDTLYNDHSTKPYSGYYRHAFDIIVNSFTKRIDFTNAPTVFGSEYYDGNWCNTMEEITGIENVTKFGGTNGYFSFSGNVPMDTISFPNVTEIPNGFFCYSSTVRELYFPKCKKIGSRSLCYNYCLQKVTVEKGCEIDPTALQNNYQYVEIVEV